MIRLNRVAKLKTNIDASKKRLNALPTTHVEALFAVCNCVLDVTR